MRTLERLIAVMQSVNWEVWAFAAGEMRQAATDLQSGYVSSMTLSSMVALQKQHPSEHIRELAREAEHYVCQALHKRQLEIEAKNGRFNG